MASEIRANSITSRAGLSTVTMTDSGPMFSGITTFVDNSGFTFGVGGGTSIFTPATNILTLGTNNTEKVRIDANGNANITGVTTAANFKTGVSNLHNAGLTLSGGQLDVGSNIKVGTAGVITATSFVGSGANLTSLPSQATIANNADNRVITGGSGVNLNGESGLTYNGSTLGLSGSLAMTGGSISLDGHSLIATAGFTDISGGSYAARLGSTGSSTIRSTQIYGGGNHLATFDGVNARLGVNETTPEAGLHITGGLPSIRLENSGTSASAGDILGQIDFKHNDSDDAGVTAAIKCIAEDNAGNSYLTFHNGDGGNADERLRIASDGKFGFATSSPSAYALATFNSDNGIQLQGSNQTRILMRDSGGPTNLKMMDIMCDAGTIFFRTIADNYTTATQRASFRSDGNFVVGNRVGTSSVSTNQPVAFHSPRVSPDGNPRRVSTGQRCNLFVGSNSGWAAGDGGTLGLGGSETGSAGVEGMWTYLKGARQSGNGWQYAGYFELGTSPWSGTNMAKRVKIWADGQIEIYPTDNTFFSTQIGGAQRLIMEHTGGGNIRMRNTSSGTVTYQTSSDYRLKENVVNITNALTTVKALKPYEYKWKHDGKLGQGFFAHEAQETLPDIGIVSGTKDGVHTEDPVKDEHHTKGDPIYQSIDYSKLVPLLTAALQEAITKVETLEQDNIALRARVTNLEGN